MKKSLKQGGTRGVVEASGGVRASLLPASNLSAGFWVPTSLSYSVRSIGGLTQDRRQVVQDSGAIAKDGGLNVILSNGLTNSLGIKLLKL